MRPFLVSLCILFLFSCNRESVGLDETNARGEVPQLGNLTFRFSNALVGDSLLNRWDSTEYIRFTPAIAGRFRWAQPDQLVFSPARPLPPATSFTAELKDDILAYSKFGRITDARGIAFHTPALRLEDMQAVWVPDGDRPGTAVARLDLYFNYPVSPAALQERLRLEAEGQPAGYRMQTLSEDSRISITMPGIVPSDKDITTGITIGKGLVPVGGKDATGEDMISACNIPSPFNLVIGDIVAQHDGLSGTVYIHTSQMVSEDIAPYIKLDPAVTFSTEQVEDGFILKSDHFDADKTYLLTIKKGLTGTVGGILREQSDNNIAFGELEPAIRFNTNKSVYLSGKGNRMIEMRIVNVPRVKVVVSKIYESNLLTAQHYGYYPNDRESGYYGDYGNNPLTPGDIIYEQEIDTRTLPQSGNSRLLHFDVADRLPDFKGIYHVLVRSASDYWLSDSRFISVSDLGLIAREGRDKLFVFANSIQTAKPMEGANVIAYGSNNQVLAMGATNADGVAELAYTRREFEGFAPAMVVAKTASDFNYLPFGNTKVNTSRFETGGRRGNATALDAFIYAERDIYRPGEKVNYSVIVRNRQWETPAGIILKCKFLLPNGKELATFRKTLNDQGSAEGHIDISPAAITGSYTLEVYASNDVLLGSRDFHIEEFVPDRIKLSASLDKPLLRPGMTAALSLNAVNFFGPPAADRHYELEVQVKPKHFLPKKFSGYDFTIRNQGLSLDKIVREGRTDKAGNASEKYEVPTMFRNSGILQADFYTTVFDETGRPVSRNVSADIFTQSVFFGIADDGYSYYPLNQPIRFGLIALDRDEKTVAGAKATVRVIRHEYRNVLSKSGSYFRYESQESDKVLSEQVITVSGDRTLYTFVPRSPGNYELRVHVDSAAGYVSKQFYSYGSWGGDNNSFEVNTDGSIDIETDKAEYVPGETARILFKAPFNGRLLVTLESDNVISYQYLDVAKKNASMELKIQPDYLPNVFITATLIKPHGISDIPLTAAHGFQNVKVKEEKRRNRVAIVAEKSSRSKTTQTITVKADPGSYVTLAAVDNGVLQVSDFKTPDPYGFFYAPRALEVTAYDLYPYLFPELRARRSSTGGDADREMQKRVNPMPSKRVKIVSYWSGIVKTNGNGQAKFSVHIPAFSGQVRLMAVAYRNNTFGSSESTITVADPVVISTAMPRFLSPRDTLQLPVTLTNTTAQKTVAVVRVRSSGPLSVLGTSSQSVALAPNEEARPVFRVVASPEPDTGRIYVEVSALNAVFTDETAISVRPASPLQVLTGSGSAEGGTEKKLTIPVADLLPGSASYKLVISRSPLLELGGQLRYLVQYPYGCTEQIISSAFPQLYYSELASQFLKGSDASAVNDNILEAIRKIRLRQLYNGAVTLWDNEGTENWWSTIYAAHFLLEARKAGFDADNDLLNGMLNYINQRLRNKQTITYYYNRDQQRKIAPKEIPYSLYVLALASRPNISAMNYYKANARMLSLDGRYLLSAAYGAAGDKKGFREMLPPSFSGEVSVAQTGGSFYSPIRDEAISLNALMDIDPGNAQIPEMARHVADQLQQRQWFSTQECAFSFLALGKLAKASGKSTATAVIRVNGKEAGRFNGTELTLSRQQLKGNAVELAAKGTGKLYYYWQAEGISASGTYQEEDRYIKVRRQFYDRYGKKWNGLRFKQNDLVVVQLTLDRAYEGDVENIVVTDMLPAGFEIENPRVREIPGMDWIKDATVPTALDVRDDRINLFTDLSRNRQVYYYAVRAVSPGAYRMGPVSAVAMYNGDFHSYHGAGTITIDP